MFERSGFCVQMKLAGLTGEENPPLGIECSDVAFRMPDLARNAQKLGGSVLARQPTFAAGVIAKLRERGVTGPFVTVDDGTVGAAVLALRLGGVEVAEATFERIRTTLAALR